MKKVFVSLFALLIFIGCQPKRKSEKVIIATAANVQFAMKELIQAFKAETGIDGEAVISSSGKLTAQIKEGAPFDVFVSADMKYPMKLFSSGFALQKPQVYAYGKLVLWSNLDSVMPTIEMLATKKIKHIALANPKTAPYGAAAVAVLKHKSIYEKIEPKLVYGESIAQTNQFIMAKAAEAGFTAKSVVLSPEMKEKGKWIEIDSSWYTPIEQGAVVLNTRKNKRANAQKFYNFLFSASAKDILKKYGYSTESK